MPSLSSAPPSLTPVLPFWVTVGFVGHLDHADPADGARLGQAFEIIRQAFAMLPEVEVARDRPHHEGGEAVIETLGQAYGGPLRPRLLTGAAKGGDRMAIQAWRDLKLGEVHALFPFRDPETGEALTDIPERAGPEERIADLTAYDAWSGLDGLHMGFAKDQSHAEIGRWIVRGSDILMAFWDEKRARKPGGVADSVARALERGLIVVWVKPGDDHIRLITPRDYLLHAEVVEVAASPADHARPLTAEALRDLLAASLSPPRDHTPDPHGKVDAEVAARRDYARTDPLLPAGSGLAAFSGWFWGAFGFFRAWAGDLANWTPPCPSADAPPAELDALAAYAVLKHAFAEADARANHLGAIHRSEQLILAFVAPLAVLASVISAFPKDSGKIEHLHELGAGIEFTLGMAALVVFGLARRAHRHRRWSDARRLAERLRTMVTLWPLGVDLADAAVSPNLTWTEWRARALLRAAGPPQGWLDRPVLEDRARWAVAELIGGQINYHAKEAHASHTIDTRIEAFEFGAFILLMASLFLFLIASLFFFLVAHGLAARMSPPIYESGLKRWLLIAVLVLGPFAPAVGAAGLALRATNGFVELARRSAALRPEYARLADDFWALDEAGKITLRQAQQILREAARLLVEDADSWRDRLVSRKTERGG